MTTLKQARKCIDDACAQMREVLEARLCKTVRTIAHNYPGSKIVAVSTQGEFFVMANGVEIENLPVISELENVLSDYGHDAVPSVRLTCVGRRLTREEDW